MPAVPGIDASPSHSLHAHSRYSSTAHHPSYPGTFSFWCVRVPDEALHADVEGTVVHEYLKPDSTRQAEFLRFRQRFIDDASCPVKIPEDFDFAHYMTLCISKSLAKVVEVSVTVSSFQAKPRLPNA